MEITETYQTLKRTSNKSKGTSSNYFKMGNKWLLIVTIISTIILVQINPSQGAVIKRENGVHEQELMAKQLEVPSASVAEQNRLDSVSRARAIDAMRNANRIAQIKVEAEKTTIKPNTTATTTKPAQNKEPVAEIKPDDIKGDLLIEDLDDVDQADDVDAVTSLDDAPIPTFAPFDINRYTSSYHDDGVAESEPLREKDGGGGGYTTVDYEQRFDRIELTTQPGSEESGAGPYGMFRQEAHRFDTDGMRMEDEEEIVANEPNLNMIRDNSTNERNSTAYFNNMELESIKYDIQADEAKLEKEPSPTTGLPPRSAPSQKRGKYLQNPEEATANNAELNDSNLSLPSTADVWALAAMKNVEHTKTKAGVYFNNTAERNSEKEAVNGTSQTKILTDWLEIMKNSELASDKYLGNDIPVVRVPAMEETREENKVVEVVVTPPSTAFQRPTNVRRFDETVDTTTEFNGFQGNEEDFSIPISGPDGGTRVSDNLYYDDFTTDLPESFTTTESPEPLPMPTKVSNIQQIKSSGSSERVTTTTPVPDSVPLTTVVVPRNEINTVPNESSFDRKTTEAVNEIVSPLESTSLTVDREEFYNEDVSTTTIKTTTTVEKLLPNPMITTLVPRESASSATVANDEEEEEQQRRGDEVEPILSMTTEEPPRIIPLRDSGFGATTEKAEEVEQHYGYQNNNKNNPQKTTEELRENTEKSDAVHSATLKSPTTEIANNSIERNTENRGAGESNSLPEYTVVEQQKQPSLDGEAKEEGTPGSGVGDATTTTTTTTSNNFYSNGNYLEAVNTASGSQSNAATNNDHEADEQQHNNRPDYVMTTSPTTGATRTAVRSSRPTNTSGRRRPPGESGAAAAATEQSNSAVVDFAAETTIRSAISTTTEEPWILDKLETTTTTTMSSERIELDQRHTNGHQVVVGATNNDTLNVAGGGSSLEGIGGEATSTEPEGRDVNAIIAITVSVIAVVALVLLVGFLYVMRKRQKQLSYGQRCQPVGLDAYSLDNVSVYNSVRRKNNNLRLSKRSYGNSAFEDPGLKFNNLSIQGLAIMVNNKDEINEEFKEIPLITARVDEVPPGCEDKNRYANVVPLPETRVHLKQLNGDEKTEYINANYVRGPKDTVNYYIACQAPMENTIVDFWRMIWEQNSKVVCQLTDLTENGIEKCAEYLPPSAVLDTNRVFGDFGVTLKNREVKDKYAVSTIHLRNAETNTWREITHFWYQWPEEGMPMDETSVIAMLLEVRSYLKMAMPEQSGNSDEDDAVPQDEQEKQRKIQELNDELTEKLDEEGGEKKANGTLDKTKSLQRTQGPLTVHCSPGTGRTGTIIGCDIALRSLEMKNRSVDVPQITYYVRRGRASSIKTRDQYEFIYRCANTYAQKLMEPIVEN